MLLVNVVVDAVVLLVLLTCFVGTVDDVGVKLLTFCQYCC